MIFIWGTKRTERKLGLVADFCPICRDLRSFHMVRVGVANHIYYLSFGDGKLVGYLIRCQDCGVDLGVEPTRFVHVEPGHQMELEDLIRTTHPRVRENYAERLELEARIKNTRATLAPDEYQKFMLESFSLLNPQLEVRFGKSTQFDKPASLGCLSTVILVLVLFFGSMAFMGPTQDKLLIATLVIGFTGLVYTFIQLHLAPGRYFHNQVLPALVKALRPLEPTKDDLVRCLERCQTLGMKIGKVAKVNDIWAQLEGQPPTSNPKP